LAAGLLVALLAGIVAFVTLSRSATARQSQASQTADGPTVQVVIASQAVPVRTLLTAEMLTVKAVPVDATPAGYLGEIEQAVGKMTATDLVQGEAVVASRLVDPDVVSGDGRLALVVNDDQVLMAFPPDDLMSKIGLLKPGDHVDILVTIDVPVGDGGSGGSDGASLGTESERTTVDLLSNVTIAGIVAPLVEEGPVEPQALLVTVDPQDAMILKYAKDNDGVIDLVLRAPGAEQAFETEAVDSSFFINKYRIPVQAGR
jgi:pilus assembly protein CpaB